MKLEVGMYVRTKKGEIYKLSNDKFANNVYISTDDNLIWEQDILKASHSIIDLIEVGDYVNGHKITNIAIQKRLLYTEDAQIIIRPENIKSIVTREQMEAMQYKVV